MKQYLFLVILTSIFLGCGGKSKAPETKATESDAVTKTPAADPAAYVGSDFLPEQARKREELVQAIAEYNMKKGDPGVVRYKILTRKGELMSAKRNIRASTRFTDAQKDSLLRPLEEESVSLATDLLAVSK